MMGVYLTYIGPGVQLELGLYDTALWGWRRLRVLAAGSSSASKGAVELSNPERWACSSLSGGTHPQTALGLIICWHGSQFQQTYRKLRVFFRDYWLADKPARSGPDAADHHQRPVPRGGRLLPVGGTRGRRCALRHTCLRHRSKPHAEPSRPGVTGLSALFEGATTRAMWLIISYPIYFGVRLSNLLPRHRGEIWAQRMRPIVAGGCLQVFESGCRYFGEGKGKGKVPKADAMEGEATNAD